MFQWNSIICHRTATVADTAASLTLNIQQLFNRDLRLMSLKTNRV